MGGEWRVGQVVDRRYEVVQAHEDGGMGVVYRVRHLEWDTDLAVKLVDVYPDGTAYNVQSGMLRLRYRNGFEKPQVLTPGQVYKVEIGGMATANYFGPGHRLRIEIAGSDFPNSDRNWNTGSRNELETSGVVANVAIYHGAQRASYIEFTQYTGPIPQRADQ